jgi:hypothetical protein
MISTQPNDLDIASGFHTARVKRRNTRCEQMFSALPGRADIARRSRYVRFVPTTDQAVPVSRIAAVADPKPRYALLSQMQRTDQPPCNGLAHLSMITLGV